jgi:thiamine kinase-like enzyme
VTLEPLAAGLVNDSYRVERDGRLYSMRLAADTLELGVDREWECRVLQCAARAGIAPVTICCQPSRGVLVAEWTGGDPWTAEELRQPGNIRALTGLMRRVHDLAIPGPARIMSPGAWIAYYGRAAARTGKQATASAGLRAAANVHLERLAAIPSTPLVLCHSDLHRLNVAAGERLMLLDWEYAQRADPLYDVACALAYYPQAQPQAAELLAAAGLTGAGVAARLEAAIRVYDGLSRLWLWARASPRPD